MSFRAIRYPLSVAIRFCSGALQRERALPPLQRDPAIYGLELEVAAAGADGAVEAARAEASLHGERVVGLDVTVDGAGVDACIQVALERERDAAVHRLELERAGPVGAAHRD